MRAESASASNVFNFVNIGKMIIKVGLSLAYFSLLIRFGAPLLDGKWDHGVMKPSTVLLFNSKALSTDSSSMNVINAKMFFPHTTRILSIVPHLLNIASSLAGSTDSKCSRFIMLIERVAFCSMSFNDLKVGFII
ncbi:hypothetical protein GQX74_006300 [Glossina fuscipes]|nr:hypothetical protein GQX74_006300 [Glossina fuscipes]